MLTVAANGRTLCGGRYTLLEKLGAGGQGEVWRAYDGTRGAEVALKILSPSLARIEAAWNALVREHAITSRLDHPSILKVHPPERDGDAALLPMELAPGGDLRRMRGASYLDVIPVLIELAQALEHAHERGVVHRDLKPGNVLFDARGRVRLADFGVAGGPGLGDAARGGLSPFTASPEQLRGERPAVSDDIYGLGALAYELLSGYPPFYPRFDPKRVLEEPVPPLKPTQQVPPQLAGLVMRMLAKRPQARPHSMRDVIDELDAALNDTLTFDFDHAHESEAAPAVVLPPASEPPRHPPAQRAGEPFVPPAGPADDRAAARAAAAAAAAGPAAARRARAEPAFVAPEDPLTVADEPVQTPDPATRTRSASEWSDIRIERVPSLMRVEPIRPRRWPWVVLALLIAAAVGVFYWLPQYAPRELALGLPTLQRPPATAPAGPGAEQPRSAEAPAAPAEAGPADTPSPAAPMAEGGTPPAVVADATTPAQQEQQAVAAEDAASRQRLQELRTQFDRRLATLEQRGAGQWGGRNFATAKTRSAEAVGAADAGNPALAAERLGQAMSLLEAVEKRAPQALAAQLAAGDRAIEAGNAAAAVQAFEFARRIDPRNARAAQGLQRARNLDAVLPLIAEGENAEAAKDHARAVQAYGRALKLDPVNTRAKEGLARANAAFGEDAYARAVGSGFAALGAGRLEEAQQAFEQARGIRPNGREAADGLARVGAALRARGFGSTRQRAAALEAAERWSEAAQEYEAALKQDPSLAFAQQGRARALQRAELGRQLQGLIDRPERLATPAVRAEALALIERASAISPSGPVLRSQITRLEILLPEFDKPVRLALVSDNATQVAIQRVGSFGAFSRREIELKPGKYTVVGTREGYRDVRRDITIAPGQDIQTISVACVEPI